MLIFWFAHVKWDILQIKINLTAAISICYHLYCHKRVRTLNKTNFQTDFLSATVMLEVCLSCLFGRSSIWMNRNVHSVHGLKIRQRKSCLFPESKVHITKLHCFLSAQNVSTEVKDNATLFCYVFMICIILWYSLKSDFFMFASQGPANRTPRNRHWTRETLKNTRRDREYREFFAACLLCLFLDANCYNSEVILFIMLSNDQYPRRWYLEEEGSLSWGLPCE